MWQSSDIAQATTGIAYGPAFTASSVIIDSRKVVKGALFVALRGERADGHDYVKGALAAGAAGALVHRLPDDGDKGMPLIVVNDSYKALVDLASASRKRTRAKIIAVTGSVGKTGTKEAIRAVLASAGHVYATEGNLNNHIGLPLSLANLPQDARFGVFELGMNHAGELMFLTGIARPDIAVITNVEAVHLEFFTGLEKIADAKAEIMEGVPRDGTVILNRDNSYFDQLSRKARALGIRHIVTFGAHEEAHCRLVSYGLQDMSSRVEAVIHGVPIVYRLGAIGRHWAMTSLAALASAMAAGADLANAAAALAHFYEPDGRGRLQRLEVAGGFVTLIDDCYNASPSSAAAAIAKLAEIKTALAPKGRAIAVLGDMLELGATAPDLHKGLLAVLAEHHIDKVYLAGPLMKHLFDALPSAMRGQHEGTSAALAPRIAADLRAGDVVLVKGSHGSRMDILRDALLLFSSSRPLKAPRHVV
jgi:UDP-N-acetylmuramoyl-tripeptide--D-alanyl-D-alanine ligase